MAVPTSCDTVKRINPMPLEDPPFEPQCWESIDNAITRNAAGQVAFRRRLHRCPEPSGEEVETTRLVAEKLREAGLAPRLLRDGLGLVVDATLGNPTASTPRIAIRADMDALRIQDDKTVDYRSSVSGVMHACGHDGHTAIVLGAALAVAGAAGDWPTGTGVTLRFLFQPAEETSDGARWLIEQDVLDGVDAILGVHMEPSYPAGHVGIRYGVLTAACDEMHIVVAGHGGHAARPHQTRDPILASAQLICALYGILPRRLDARSPAVLTVARVQAGSIPNAIPERAEITGTLRTIELETREALLERVADVAQGVATMTGTKITPEFRYAIPSVVNDGRLAQAFETASADVLGTDAIVQIAQPSMGGEDFAFYLQHVPGAMLRLGCTPAGATPVFLHSPRFDIDERSLAIGSRILLRAAAVAARRSV